MTAQIIDGKKVADSIYKEVKKQLKSMKIKPGIALVLVGNDPASHVYVSMKEKKAKEIGLYCEKHVLSENAKDTDILELIEKLNGSKKIHGILVQLPLPKQINEKLIVDAILPYKDVDGLTPVNLGFLVNDDNMLVAATSLGILELIKSTKQEVQGKHAVVVGRSTIVGKPTALLLLQKNATVTICHSKTKNLKEITKQADILVAAVGKPRLIKKDMVKPGAIVIDAGTVKENEVLVGDVDYDAVKEVAGYITPVPGGVGPMTIAMLISNTVKAAQMQRIN